MGKLLEFTFTGFDDDIGQWQDAAVSKVLEGGGVRSPQCQLSQIFGFCSYRSPRALV